METMPSLQSTTAPAGRAVPPPSDNAGPAVAWWNNPWIARQTPLVTMLLFEGSNVSHLWRMWSEHSAAGQSLTAWVMSLVAVSCWANYHRLISRDRVAVGTCLVAFVAHVAAIATVVMLRYGIV